MMIIYSGFLWKKKEIEKTHTICLPTHNYNKITKSNTNQKPHPYIVSTKVGFHKEEGMEGVGYR